MKNKKQSRTQKKYALLVLLIVVLIFLRVPGLHTSYYQDEYKWPEIVAKNSPLAGTVPHPPLSEKVYVAADRLFGNDNLRVMPFLFSIANAFLLYAIVEMLFGIPEALLAVGMFAVSFYSVLASLMVDTDGQILPFYFLMATLGYLKWKRSIGTHKKIWLVVFIISVVLGFLTKLSFIIPAGAFILDYLYDYRSKLNKKRIVATLSILAGAAALLVIALINAHYFFSNFNFSTSFAYWLHFAKLSNRNYFQTFIELMKSMLYLSPLLVLPLFLVSKEILHKTRLFWFCIGLGLLFYLVIFDFSGGALDRYLQFLIVPLCVIGGPILIERFRRSGNEVTFSSIIGSVILAFGLFALQFIRQTVPALHPKSQWLSRIIHFKWNFLFPFNGGSGPLGFYVSWLFMSSVWIISILILIAIFYRRSWQKPLLLVFIIMSVLYNCMFIEEYLVGGVNGSTRTVLADTLAFIADTNEIKHVTTYNDIGGFELMQMGKYRKRLYIDPKFDVGDKIKSFNAYKEHYLVVDVPRIDPTTVYVAFFNSCKVMFRETSGYVSSTVYDCTHAPDITL